MFVVYEPPSVWCCVTAARRDAEAWSVRLCSLPVTTDTLKVTATVMEGEPTLSPVLFLVLVLVLLLSFLT